MILRLVLIANQRSILSIMSKCPSVTRRGRAWFYWLHETSLRAVIGPDHTSALSEPQHSRFLFSLWHKIGPGQKWGELGAFSWSSQAWKGILRGEIEGDRVMWGRYTRLIVHLFVLFTLLNIFIISQIYQWVVLMSDTKFCSEWIKKRRCSN